MFKSRQEITRLMTIIIETLYEVCPHGDVAESMVYLALKMDLAKSNALLTLCVDMGWIKRKGNRIGLTDAGRKLMADAHAEVAAKAGV
jgi:hypothetical protein